MIRRCPLVLLCVALLPTAALAQTQVEQQARALATEGLTSYREGRYNEAIESFRRAYVLVRAPLLLFDIAQAYRLKGDAFCAQALEGYRSFVRDAEPTNASVAVAQEQLPLMEACVARQKAAAPEAPPNVAPAEPVREEPVSAPAPLRRFRSRKQLALQITAPLLLAAGAAMVGTGGYFAQQAVSANDGIGSTCSTVCQWSDSLAALEETNRVDRTRAIALVVTGGVALIGGGVSGYFGWRSRP